MIVNKTSSFSFNMMPLFEELVLNSYDVNSNVMKWYHLWKSSMVVNVLRLNNNVFEVITSKLAADSASSSFKIFRALVLTHIVWAKCFHWSASIHEPAVQLDLNWGIHEVVSSIPGGPQDWPSAAHCDKLLREQEELMWWQMASALMDISDSLELCVENNTRKYAFFPCVCVCVCFVKQDSLIYFVLPAFWTKPLW